jgi:NADH-quinone oxidoreductase subunit C
MHNEIVEFLNANVSGCNAVANIAEVGDSSVTVASSHIKTTCSALKESDKFKMNVLQVISAVDYPEESEIELNYIIASFIENTELILKTRVPRGDENSLPSVESVCDVWKAANYQEREAYDMIGVNFEGHPDFRRILCPDDWKGYPLRKDYVVEEVYNGMTVNPEEKINREDIEFFAKMRLDREDPTEVSGSWVDDHLWIDQDLTSKAKDRVAEAKAAKKAKKDAEKATSTEEKGE